MHFYLKYLAWIFIARKCDMIINKIEAIAIRKGHVTLISPHFDFPNFIRSLTYGASSKDAKVFSFRMPTPTPHFLHEKAPGNWNSRRAHSQRSELNLNKSHVSAQEPERCP